MFFYLLPFLTIKLSSPYLIPVENLDVLAIVSADVHKVSEQHESPSDDVIRFLTETCLNFLIHQSKIGEVRINSPGPLNRLKKTQYRDMTYFANHILSSLLTRRS